MLNVAEVADTLGAPADRILQLTTIGACPVWYADHPTGERFWDEESLGAWRQILATTEASPLSDAEAALRDLIREVLDEIAAAEGRRNLRGNR